MRRILAISIAGALCGASLCRAQDAAEHDKLPFKPSQVNAARLRWMQYKMVTGRVVATSPYPEGMNISFGPSVLGGRLREQLQILILKDQVSVRYELAGDGQELAIELSEKGDFSIRRTGPEPDFAMHYVQRAGEPVVLTVAEVDRRRVVTGDSFWNVYIAAPTLVRDELVPYLQLLRPAWQLATTGAAIEEALFRAAEAPGALDHRDWRQLVDELGDTSFSRRERAQRELYQQGQVILPYLEALARDTLDAEQAARVDELIDSLAVEYEDTTGRIAAWLVGDPHIWLSLIDRPQLAKRQVAARQLERLTGGPIEFNPAADAATRMLQADKLRERLNGSTGPPEAKP